MARLVNVLINKCIESSLVPRQRKQANVTLVPKCKYCTTLSHCRPISVLPVLSKVSLNMCCIIRLSHILLKTAY